ncbi:MAG: hypothetical protein JWP37_3475 [Mucilaginibacter sp.]|nr:hypothetical protein [Mucilaginibacter sp.]
MILLDKTISFVDFMGVLGAFAAVITIPVTLDQLRKSKEKRKTNHLKSNQLALIAGALENQTDLLTQRLALIVLPKLRIGKIACTAAGDINIELTNKGEVALINDFSYVGLKTAKMNIPLNLDKGEQVNIIGKLIDDNTEYEITVDYIDAMRQKHQATIEGIGGDVKILSDDMTI